MSEKYVALTYIGRAEEKRDNILHNTSRVWKRGGSRRVPLAEYEKYMAHPDEFALTTPYILLSPVSEEVSSDEQLSALLTIISNLDETAAREVIEAATVRLAETQALGKISIEDRSAFSERKRKIIETVAGMDDTDHALYTDSGRPRVAVVAQRSGLSGLTSAEIQDALKYATSEPRELI